VADIQKLANPYDFANPVADGELFIGRKEELSEIKYYLSQALLARRPTNIALIGNRASGKTSLLNVTEQDAKKLGLLTVRIDLDEGDAASQWAFFFKLFDSILSAACDHGAYGGKHANTFETYVDMTCSLSIPEDKTFCPFLFPIQYAKALGGNNLQAQVPDYSFRRDLEAVQAELNRPVVILFDEGNVLSKSRVHLQKLRNIFMNSRGYMLVLTGTPEMFPVMDDVFSPIIRQFRKINLDQFDDVEDTEELIRRYLQNAGVDPDSLFDFDESNDLEDIHDLTGGRPYELQLVCHTLFRRVQQGRAQRMSLDLGVIEEVRQQLESAQKFADRPVLSKIRSLDTTTLNALATLAPCVEKATFEQMCAIEQIFAPEKWDVEALRARFLCLKEENILGENPEGIVQFRGDDFDRIYTKYFSAEKEVTVQFSEFPFSVYMRMRLDNYVRSSASVRSIRPIQTSEKIIDIDLAVKEMAMEGIPTKVYVETSIPILRAIYNLLFDSQGHSEISVVDCTLSLFGNDAQGWYVHRKKSESEAMGSCINALQVIKARVNAMDFKCAFQLIQIQVPRLESVLNQIVSSGNRRLAELIAVGHANRVLESYTSKQGPSTMGRNAKAAYDMRVFLSPTSQNNIGYYFLSVGDFEKARNILELSVSSGRKLGKPSSLAIFNLAMTHVQKGDTATAIDLLGSISEFDESDSPYCLFVPRPTLDGLRLIELKENPDLKDEIQKALVVLSTGDNPPN
jgi:hypothetical protein